MYRLIVAAFLHVNFLHLLGNMFAAFILLTRVEYTFGPLLTFIMYIICAIGGNIFSLAVDSNNNYYVIKAGASTAIFGMVGVPIGYLIINWSGLDNVGSALKCQMVCSIIFLLIFILIFTPSSVNSNIDYFGHLGGLLTGIWVAAFKDPLINEKR